MRMLFRICLLIVCVLCPPVAPAAAPAATVGMLTGEAQAVSPEGISRPLAEGDAVHSGDTLLTGPGAYLDLDFADGGQILLRPGSEFRIEDFRYTAAAEAGAAPRQAGDDRAFFRLLKGAFRAVSGLIGKQDHADYGVETPIATIGIRGTEYEARWCQADCAGEPGLYAGVEEGAIALINERGETRLQAGEFAYLAGRRAAVQRLTRRPGALPLEELRDMDAPRMERLMRRYRLFRHELRQRLREIRRQRN